MYNTQFIIRLCLSICKRKYRQVDNRKILNPRVRRHASIDGESLICFLRFSRKQKKPFSLPSIVQDYK